MIAPPPSNESGRLHALHRYDVLDTVPEQAFDDLTLLAAHICQVPIAMVSLIDDQRQWFKSTIGMTSGETARGIAFCAHTILQPDEVMEVRDATADPRFAENPFVLTNPRIRFYAGAALVTSGGHALGALCVMDHQPRALDTSQRLALQALSRRVVAQLELRLEARGLAIREAEVSLMMLTAEKSRRALLGVLEDEKRAGESLRASETRFRQMAENIGEVFWMADANMAVVHYASPAYEKIWGRTCDSLYRKPSSWMDAIHPEDRDAVRRTMLANVTGDYEQTYRIERPDGSLRWIRDRAFPIRNQAGEVYRLAGIAEDLTENRQLEAQFHQAQKMEALGTLAGGVAHDFNNILCGVMGYAELARLNVVGNAAAIHDIDAVLEAARRAVDLVSQILAFSRQQDQQRSLVQLRHLVAEPLKLLRATLPSTLRLEMRLSNDTPLVEANATQIHQVVMNLCTNAWHAMRDRSARLEVSLQPCLVDETLSASCAGLEVGNYALLSISDTGMGMDDATRGRIFEPFFTTKKAGEGTGLGLSVVHNIMRSHGGAIKVRSEVGVSTTFDLYFPARIGEAEETSTNLDTPLSEGGEHVLFIDDEPRLIELGQAMLKELGYSVTTCLSGTEALKLIAAATTPFALVITDLTMPEITGAELIVELRRHYPSLPSLLTSGFLTNQTRESLKTLGIEELLEKPYTFRTLGSAVHEKLAAVRKDTGQRLASPGDMTSVRT